MLFADDIDLVREDALEVQRRLRKWWCKQGQVASPSPRIAKSIGVKVKGPPARGIWLSKVNTKLGFCSPSSDQLRAGGALALLPGPGRYHLLWHLGAALLPAPIHLHQQPLPPLHRTSDRLHPLHVPTTTTAIAGLPLQPLRALLRI